MNSIFWQELPEALKNNPDMNLQFRVGNATAEIIDSRYIVCKPCENFNQTEFTCSSCGCNMGIGITRAAAICPENKW